MDYANTPPEFIFPILKVADILQCMSELNIELSKEELTEPNRFRDKIRKIFLTLVCSVKYVASMFLGTNALIRNLFSVISLSLAFSALLSMNKHYSWSYAVASLKVIWNRQKLWWKRQRRRPIGTCMKGQLILNSF